LARGQEVEIDPERRKALLEGTHVFRRILHDHGMTALEGFDDELLVNSPEKCLVVVLGDLDQLRYLPRGLSAFIRGGGALLAASDRALQNGEVRKQLRDVAGVSINAEPLICPNWQECYQGVAYCPWLVPLEGGAPLFRAPAGPLRVATNVPSKLRIRVIRFPGSVQPLIELPASCRVETPRGAIQEGTPTFGVGGDVDKGRVLVLADHSIFINQMMLPTDNNNVEFTWNCVRWLTGEEKQRDRVLFVEDGRIQTKLEIPLKSAKLPIEEALKVLFAKRNEILLEVEKGVGRMEDNNFFNRKVVDFLDRSGWPPIRLLTPLAVVSTLVFLLYLVYRLGIRHRFRHDSSVPLLAPAVGRNLPVGPLLAQRTDALMQRGNLQEPAAFLARRWFARLGMETSQEQEPAFEAQGGWWQRRRLLGRLRWLWRLASGRQPGRLSPPEIWRLQRELDELRTARERGAWRVANREGEAPAEPERPMTHRRGSA
jgi:hypothetical protein